MLALGFELRDFWLLALGCAQLSYVLPVVKGLKVLVMNSFMFSGTQACITMDGGTGTAVEESIGYCLCGKLAVREGFFCFVFF